MPGGETAPIPVVMGMGRERLDIVNRMTLPAPASRVVRVTGCFKNMFCRLLPGAAVVRGVLHKDVGFVSTHGEIIEAGEDIPFAHTIHIPGATHLMSYRVRPAVSSICARLIHPNVLEQRSAVDLDVLVIDEQPAPFSRNFRAAVNLE